MITGAQLREARESRRWTQEQLAEAVGVTLRSIGNWERGSVPANREARIRDVLGDHLTPGGNPLTRASDLALISELARRLEARAQSGGSHGVADPEQKSAEPTPSVDADPDIALSQRSDMTLQARHKRGGGHKV